MIEIATAQPDATGYQSFEEIAPSVFRDATTGEVIITDGVQSLLVTITQE